MASFRTSERASNEHWEGRHRFEHWYRDNQVYFITARCKDKCPAFASEEAKHIFWQRFDKATAAHGFHSWVTSLLDNHYHTVGYLERGEELPKMMHQLHGATAKLVNDLLERKWKSTSAGGLQPACHPALIEGKGRLLPFWCDSRRKNYFDGCLRNEKQGRKTYTYVLIQAERHGLVSDWRQYPHTRLIVGVEEAIAFALERHAFLEGVPYKRYEQERPGRRA